MAGSERCLALILDLFPDADVVVGLTGSIAPDLNTVTRRRVRVWLARIPTARTNYQCYSRWRHWRSHPSTLGATTS